MKEYVKKPKQSLTEKNKKYECSECGRKMRKTKSKESLCDSCKKLYGIK